VLVLDPERLLSADISIIVLLMTVLGGSGTLWGPALGAAILIPLSEYSRIWFGGTGRTIDLIVYGLLILAVCIWRPNGILSLFEEAHPAPRREAHMSHPARRQRRDQALRRPRPPTPTSPSTSTRARSSASSARTAPASRRCST
jgi:hypothetical protein